ncbi:MAG: hypothetical protein DRI44_04060 [Chlamydiae bacterium]|nr:MAG: hypothetical protein DRI44_04060 [Chlamydiota bacterium]
MKKIEIRNFRMIVILFLLVVTVRNARSADWPMYRNDAARSGYTINSLPSRLSLSWVRKTDSGPQPAWSGKDTRMPFDFAFQPVVSKGMVFFGDSSDCKLYALDAKTGFEKWTFFTESPIRFAPAIWKDRIFVVSDDGFLYCLAIKDGKLLWKKRGGPDADMILGNDRLISRWPARGGPVVKDGIVYFGAGIWTSEGIFLYAIDASTGKVLWVNDTSGGLVLEQPHGGNLAKSGVSIQGYLSVAGDSLVVPTGRATPALYDRKTGDFLFFHLMKMGGGWGQRKGSGPFVTFINEDLYIAEDDVFQASDGCFMVRGIPVSSSAVLPKLIVFSHGNEIKAIKKSSLFSNKKDKKGKNVRSLGAIDWSIQCSDPVGATIIRATASNEAMNWPKATETVNPPLIVAGNTIVAGTLNNKVITADMNSKTVVSTIKLDGLAMGLAVADQALYVCTDKGTIYCFVDTRRAKSKLPGHPKELKVSRNPNPYKDIKFYDKVARKIIESTGINEGYCVDLECGNGALTYALAKESKLHIIAISKNSNQVAFARNKLSAAGLYGLRVTVIQRDPSNTGLLSHFANLVVSGQSVKEGEKIVPEKEIKRLLQPYSGKALVGKPAEMTRFVGSPLNAAGEWTHQYADAANTLCSSDDLVKGPLKMNWFKDFGFQMPSRHGRGPAPLFKNGIMIIEGVNGLHGVDAYNGNVLWEYYIKNILKPYDQEHLVGTAGTGGNMCLDDDSVFVRHGNHCLRINMKTGKLIRKYTMPCKTGVWGFVACENGTLYGSGADRTAVARSLFRETSDMKDLLIQSGSLFALAIKTGKIKWSYKADASIRHNAIAIGNNKVYFIDKPKEVIDLSFIQHKKATLSDEKTKPARLICLDADNGKILWEQNNDIYGTTLALSTKHNILLMSYQYSQRSFQLPSEKGDRLTGFRATDGKRLWDTKSRYISRPIINGDTIYMQPYSYDLLTGKQKKDFRIIGRQPGGCGPMSGSTHMLLYRSGTLGYTDLIKNTGTQNYGPMRPGCWINAIVGGGMVLMPDATDRCTCSYLIKSSVALVPSK